MQEPAVTLTNFLLTLECWLFAWRLGALQDSAGVLPWFSRLFAFLGLGAFLGGLTHGFIPDTMMPASRIVWTGNMLALGLAGASTAMAAARVALAEGARRVFAAVLALATLAYAGVVIFLTQDFLIALLAAVAPVIFLLVVLVGLYRRSQQGGVLLAVAGLALNLVGGVQQQMKLGIDPVWFNHNAVFHLIQMLAFFLLYLGSAPTARALGSAVQSRR